MESKANQTKSKRGTSRWQRLLLPLVYALLGCLLVCAFQIPLDASSIFQGNGIVQDFLWLLSLPMFVAGLIATQRSLSMKSVDLALIGFAVVWGAISAWNAQTGCNPRTAWFGYWHCIALVSGAVVISAAVNSFRMKRVVVLVCVTGFVALSIHALHQVLIAFPLERMQFRNDPDSIFSSLGLVAPEGSSTRRQFEDRLNSAEPYATFALANSLATLLAAGVVIVAFSVILRWQKVTKLSLFAPADWLLVAVCALCISACWLTGSQTSLVVIGFIAAFVAIDFRWGLQANWSRFVLVMTASAIVVGLALMYLVGTGQAAAEMIPKSIAYRAEYWIGSLAMLRDHAWLGVGFGNFQDYYSSYKMSVASETIADPHNWLFDLAVSLSVPLCLLACYGLWRLLVSRTKSSPAETELISKLHSQSFLLGAWCGGSAGWVVASLLRLIDSFAVGISWGIAIVLIYLCRSRIETLIAERPQVLRWSVLSVVLSLMLNGSWQSFGLFIPTMMLLASSRVMETKKAPSQPSSETKSALHPSDFKLDRKTLGVFVGSALLLVGYIWQCWIPVTTAWGKIVEANQIQPIAEQLALGRQAIAADPLNAEHVEFVARVECVKAMSASAESFPIFAESAGRALDQWLAMESITHVSFQSAGDRWLDLAAKANELGLADEIYVSRAAEEYQHAVERYPSSVMLNMQVATLAWLQGKMEESQRWGDLAVTLSEKTPHLDKKLEAQQVYLPVPHPFQTTGPSPWVRAEPILQQIRKP